MDTISHKLSLSRIILMHGQTIRTKASETNHDIRMTGHCDVIRQISQLPQLSDLCQSCCDNWHKSVSCTECNLCNLLTIRICMLLFPLPGLPRLRQSNGVEHLRILQQILRRRIKVKPMAYFILIKSLCGIWSWKNEQSFTKLVKPERGFIWLEMRLLNVLLIFILCFTLLESTLKTFINS